MYRAVRVYARSYADADADSLALLAAPLGVNHPLASFLRSRLKVVEAPGVRV